jgi:hypothetical protein
MPSKSFESHIRPKPSRLGLKYFFRPGKKPTLRPQGVLSAMTRQQEQVSKDKRAGKVQLGKAAGARQLGKAAWARQLGKAARARQLGKAAGRGS